MKRIGTQIELNEDERSRLIDDLKYWHRQIIDDNMLENRESWEKAFNCEWPGMNAQGVRKDSSEELAWPFEGASDQRLRWGDTIYLDFLSLVMIAISSVEVEITCGGGADAQERSRALKLLLAGLMDSLGAKGGAEIRAMIHYMLVDSPAVAALAVSWQKRVTMGVVELYIDELEAEYAAAAVAMGAAPEQAAIDFRHQLDGEADDTPLKNWLVEAKKLREKDVGKVLEALREEGECEALVAADYTEGPEVKALRYLDDFCVPRITQDFDYASPWFRGEWVTEAQLRERVADQGWDPDWVEETLDYKGYEIFMENGNTVQEDVKDLVNLVWCHMAETNERGETTRYVAVISKAEGSAFGKRVVRTRRGKWNTAFFRREVRSGNVTDSRGLAEIAAAPQGTAKSIRDMAANNAIIGSVPPIKAKGARVRNVLLQPFEVINMATNDDVTFMQPPAYPAAADKAEEKIYKDLLAFTGVSDGERDVTERRREFVLWFLEQWRDFLILLLETAQDNASDEFIIRSTATKDVKGVKLADVSGPFLIKLKLDPTNLDNKKLIEKVQAVAQVLSQVDRKGEVDTSEMVKHFFTMLFPEMAGTSFRSAEELQQDDINDEQANFVKIKAGVLPQMDTDGKWNYAARLQFYQQLQEENPDAIAEMSPTSQELFNRWIAALEQQNTQYGENAQIGRTGVEGVGAR
jgi:hypothetical protein